MQNILFENIVKKGNRNAPGFTLIISSSWISRHFSAYLIFCWKSSTVSQNALKPIFLSQSSNTLQVLTPTPGKSSRKLGRVPLGLVDQQGDEVLCQPQTQNTWRSPKKCEPGKWPYFLEALMAHTWQTQHPKKDLLHPLRKHPSTGTSCAVLLGFIFDLAVVPSHRLNFEILSLSTHPLILADTAIEVIFARMPAAVGHA